MKSANKSSEGELNKANSKQNVNPLKQNGNNNALSVKNIDEKQKDEEEVFIF